MKKTPSEKTKVTLGVLALTVFFSANAWSELGVAKTAFGEGLVMHSCAPYDGPALEARVPLQSGDKVAVIQINESLSNKPFSRPITGIGSPGGASVHLCQKQPVDPKYPQMPQVSYKSCVEAESGHIEIGGLNGFSLSGHVDVKFKDGQRLVGDFSTKLLESSKGQRC
jgi:hypothetical protein